MLQTLGILYLASNAYVIVLDNSGDSPPKIRLRELMEDPFSRFAVVRIETRTSSSYRVRPVEVTQPQ